MSKTQLPNLLGVAITRNRVADAWVAALFFTTPLLAASSPAVARSPEMLTRAGLI
jgi:hypothetical protein